MTYAFDAGPMIAYLTGEDGSEVAERILLENPAQCYAHVFNLAEIYYIFLRRRGVNAAEEALRTLYGAGIIPRDDADDVFWKSAATFKGLHALALPDGFCLALGQRLKATVVTTDHTEFDPLVTLGYCPILFIR